MAIDDKSIYDLQNVSAFRHRKLTYILKYEHGTGCVTSNKLQRYTTLNNRRKNKKDPVNILIFVNNVRVINTLHMTMTKKQHFYVELSNLFVQSELIEFCC